MASAVLYSTVRHEEDRGARPLDRDGLLGHPADVADVAVLVHGAGGRDHVAAGELAAAHLVDDAQRHGQPGRGAADLGRVDGDVDREVPVLLGLGQDAEVGGGRPATARGRSTPLGGVPSVTALSTVLPGTNAPWLLIVDSSTRSVTVVPGCVAVQRLGQRAHRRRGLRVDRLDHLGHLEGRRRR